MPWPKGRTRVGVQKPITEQTRQKLRLSHLGHIASAETRAKMSKTRLGSKGTPHKEETKELLRLALTGRPAPKPANFGDTMAKIKREKNGGEPKDPRQCREVWLWREAVLVRDHHTCQHCGITQTELAAKEALAAGKSLHAHHIKPWEQFPELRFDVDNGLTLCPSCHKKEENRLVFHPTDWSI